MVAWRWVVALVAVCVVEPGLFADAPADEVKKLEGTWTVTAATLDGKALESVKDGQWTFAGDKLTIKYKGEKETKYTYTLDPTKKPKTMDLEFAHFRVMHVSGIRINGGKSGHGADKHAHGMRIVLETLEKSLRSFMQHGVVRDIGDKVLQLRFGGKLSVQD